MSFDYGSATYGFHDFLVMAPTNMNLIYIKHEQQQVIQICITAMIPYTK